MSEPKAEGRVVLGLQPVREAIRVHGARIERLLVEGGGGINGSMLRAGVIDELSLLLVPAVDGLRGTQAVFDIDGAEDDSLGARCQLGLVSSETLSGGSVWLRYSVAMD